MSSDDWRRIDTKRQSRTEVAKSGGAAALTRTENRKRKGGRLATRWRLVESISGGRKQERKREREVERAGGRRKREEEEKKEKKKV
ncbi:hypothetical protein JCGZ_20297 [Jatropha curcas]|uniref:Uncharacterized protein n=1 Tax=Jatropha curcas TaxID=180498 RepID=A0A067K678_JATCU|nr:hypothetical protein JCGZ_20297 [Jatropha curcas]